MLGLGLGLNFRTRGQGGSSFIKKHGQPAVGLSFRDLLGSNPNIVLSRRDSDDAERLFRVKEITNGTYLNWVNASFIKYQSDFSAGTDGWVMGTADSMAGNIDGIGGENDNFRFTLGTATSSHLTYVSQLVLGQLFEISIDVFIPSSNTLANGISIVAGTAGIGIETTLDQWTTISGSAVVTVNNRLGVFVTNNGTTNYTGNGTDVVYIRNVITTQKTANGLVRTLYGQGNTLNAEQATATAQPKIVDAGVLVTKNGLPGMKFDGVNDSLDLTSEINLNNYFTTQVVSPTAYNTRVILGKNLSDYIRLDNTSGYRINPGGAFTSSTSVIGDQMLLTQKRNTSDNINLSKNGVESAEVFNNNTQLNILRIGQANGIWFFEGIMQEILIYDSDKTSEQSAIESDNNIYFRAPNNTVAPAISGVFEVGRVASCTTGTWRGVSGFTFTYQWKSDGVNIFAATNSTYTMSEDNVGKSLSCRVTATNSAGTKSINSNYKYVAEATPWITTFGQPAVGLSYRDLLGTDPVIILSRRDSDDLEASFKVSEIANGVYQNWVNEETTLFDEDFSSDPGYSLASGVTISGGKLNFSNAGNNTSSAVYAYGSADFQTVRITVEVTDYVSGRIRANNFSGGATTSPDIEANGTYVYEVTLGDGGTSWGFGSSTGTTLKVASFKVEQLTANGLVRTMYSQGNSITAQQATDSRQPLLVINGVLQMENGFPIMRRNGADGSMIIDYDVDDAVARSFFYVGKNPSQQFALLGTNDGGSDYGYLGIDGNNGATNSNLNETNQRLNLSAWDAINRDNVYDDLINQFLVVVQCSFNYGNTGLALGFRLTGSVVGMADTQEVIMYENATDNEGKEANSDAYWKADRFLALNTGGFLLTAEGGKIIV
jgi:hypothetical protein